MGIEDAYFTECILEDKDPDFKPEDAKEAVATALLAYLSAIKGKTTNMDELIDLYKTKGTKTIFEQLPKAIQTNTILDK